MYVLYIMHFFAWNCECNIRRCKEVIAWPKNLDVPPSHIEFVPLYLQGIPKKVHWKL